jgi:hypothetical protein
VELFEQECASSLDQAIRQLLDDNAKFRRTQPYVVKIGLSFFILVYGNAVLVKPNSLAVAVDVLLEVLRVQHPLSQANKCCSQLLGAYRP